MRQANVKNAKNGLNIDESILYYNKKLSLNDYINNKNIVNNNMNQFIKFYKSKNKFNKIELYEMPNFEKIKYIIDNKTKFIKSGYQRVVEDAINYKKNVKSNLLKVVYKENKDIRLKTTPSVNSNTICKNVRNFIFDDVIDLDIVNSQISVFINLINIYDLGDYPILTKVYKNKATFLKANNLSKDELIKIINNGKVNNTMDCMILCNEMDSLYNEFIKLEIFKPLYKKCMNHLNYSNDESKNIKSSFISWIYQSIECKILLLCYDYLIDNNHTISSLEYDGIKIKNNFDKVHELNNYVKLHTGLDIEFTIKEMTVDKELKLLYDNFVDSNTLIDNGTIQIADNDREASNIIYEKIKDILIFSRDNYYYKQSNVWISNFKNIRCLLINYVMDFNLFKSNDKGDLVDYSQNRRNAVNIADSILDKCVCNVNDNFVNNIFASSLGYILFNNGYYDFKNSKFVNLNDKDFNNKIIFTEKIAFDFDVKLIDNDYIHELTKHHMPLIKTIINQSDIYREYDYNGINLEDIYNTLVNDYYHNIKRNKWLIFEVDNNNVIILIIQILHDILNIDNIINDKQWNILNESQQDLFEKNWIKMITALQKQSNLMNYSYEILKSVLSYFVSYFEFHYNEINFLVKNNKYIKLPNSSQEIEEEELEIEGEIIKIINKKNFDNMNIIEFINAIKNVPAEHIYNFLYNEINEIKNTQT